MSNHTHEGCHHDCSTNKRCVCGENHSHEEKNCTSNNATSAHSCHDETDDDGGGFDDPDPSHSHHHADDCCECGHSHGGDLSRIAIYRLIIAAVAFVGALFFQNDFVRIALFSLSTLVGGYDMFIDGIKGIFRFKLDENSLLVIAVTACFVLGEYPEACIVTILLKLGGFIESIAVNRSQKNMEALTKIRPDMATVMSDSGVLAQIPARNITPLDTVYLRPGDRAAVDCIVLDGRSSVDTSALTGESIPQHIKSGDHILSGSVNLDGILKCQATKSFENSTASQIVELVYASSKLKGKTESFITRVAAIYTPIVVGLAVLIAVIPPLIFGGEFHDYIMRSLIFLMASCPCALVISIPLSFFSGIGAVSKQGVLVKGSTYIEKLAKINAVAFDKTGTLTSGSLVVDELTACDFPLDELKSILMSAEVGSAHPIAVAICEFCKGTLPATLTHLREQAGLGITAEYVGKTVLCGGKNMLLASLPNGIDISHLPPASVYVCINDKIAGYVTIKENIAPASLTIVSELAKVGVDRVVMLTGDNQKSADIVAKQCNITEVYAGLLPIGKVELVNKIKQDGKLVAFVGDGINDAPVLTVADLGISMGFGSEIANNSSDVILVSNSTKSLPQAISIAKRAMSIVYFNIIFALAIKAIVLVLGSIGLATMWFAVFADIGVTILTVLNAIRLLKKSK